MAYDVTTGKVRNHDAFLFPERTDIRLDEERVRPELEQVEFSATPRSA